MSTDFLQLLVNYRVAIKQKEAEIENIMPDAILQAFNSIGENNVVFRSQGAKIILQQKKQYQTAKENIRLERLNSEIEYILRDLAETNKDEIFNLELEITTLKNRVEELQKKKETILTSNELIVAKAKFKTEYENGMTLKPILAVQLTK
ncbi:MAG: hypothetical protein ACRC6M_03270 [Microcystaceae cyanobacterium]